MSIMPRRNSGLLVTLVLAVAGAAVAGAVLFASSRAGEVDLTTAAFVPGDTAFYVALNTDLSSGQWVRAFDLVKRMGREDPEGDLKDAVEGEGDVDWDDEVVPFLGGNAAFFASGFDWESDTFIGGIVVKAKDTSHALEVILNEVEGTVAEGEYAGIAFHHFEDDGDVFLAIIDKHLVVAPNMASLRAAVDVHNGQAPALSGDPDFIRLRDELTGNFLAFVYVRPDSLIAEAFAEFGLADVEALPTATDASPFAAVVGAAADAFEFQAASVSSGDVPGMLEPRSSRFAPMVPADTMLFATTYGVGPSWADAVAATGEMAAALSSDLWSPYPIDDPDVIAEMEASCEEYPEFCEDVDPFGFPFDPGVVEATVMGFAELLALMDGELAIAAWPGDAQAIDAILLAEVSDEARALELLDEIVAAGMMVPAEPTTIAGNDVRLVEGLVAYGVAGGYLFLGSPGAVEAVLAGVSLPMTGNATYRGAIDQMPTPLGSYLFLNLFSLLRSDAGDAIPDLDAAMRALDGLIINAVSERGVVRVSGVVTIREN
ncbi:MAG: hypothetical protein Kow0010_18610 [Dehalococcoidia bacterium]